VSPDLDARALDLLLPLVASWTGFDRDAIRPDGVRRAARSLLGAMPFDELLARARDRDPSVAGALEEGIAVGETYFFRQPEHFEHLAGVAGARAAAGATAFRAWSAGCATGEEAYSIAATLAGAAGSSMRAEVLGTDLLGRNVACAEGGSYGAWSFRERCPLLHPVWEGPGRFPGHGEVVLVSRRLRSLTAFSRANLLDPPPFAREPFDAIFCRNVLVYFSADAARAALSNLAAALAPEGVLYLGPMDAGALPPGIVEVGPPGLNVYGLAPRRAPAGSARRAGAAAPRPRSSGAAPPPPSPRPAAAEPIALHLRALALLERDDLAGAEALLVRVQALAPDYLPAALELALLCDRMGTRREAARLMREILARTASLSSEKRIPGPEELAVGYLQASARAYLGAHGGLP
jgi:chemotaxis protein methyltransferase CheR